MKEARFKVVDILMEYLNIDLLSRSWNNKQYNELKPTVFYLHDPPTLPT
jgi:hypothetical protein